MTAFHGLSQVMVHVELGLKTLGRNETFPGVFALTLKDEFPGRMISIDEAINIVLSQEVPAPVITVAVEGALGYHLAEDVLSPIALPGFDNSAMDGYAVRGAHSPYRIVGEIQAGDTSVYSLRSGEAYRIFTGAMVPENCTAVIMQEKTDVRDGELTVHDPIEEGKNIRRTGEQLQKADRAFVVGQKVNPAVISLLYSMGVIRVKVFAHPSITVLTTGNELIRAGEPLKKGQLYESNSIALKSALKMYGFEASTLHVKDDYASTHKRIAGALGKCRVLLLSGGISVGAYDFVKRALDECGVEELFYKVDQKPGKPLYFGRKADTWVFALPGNPASSLTCFYIYVLPLLQKMIGSDTPGLPQRMISLAHDYELRSDRPVFLKSVVDNDQVNISGGQGSSMLHAFASANALAFLPGRGMYEKGSLVKCYLIG